MATWAELQAYEARDVAYEAAYPRAIAETDRKVTDNLTEAQAGIIAAMMAVADACGLAPEQREELEAEVGLKAGFIASSIFNAAVLEVRKEDNAKSVARSAGETARARKEAEIRQARLGAAMSSRRIVPSRPRITKRHG